MDLRKISLRNEGLNINLIKLQAFESKLVSWDTAAVVLRKTIRLWWAETWQKTTRWHCLHWNPLSEVIRSQFACVLVPCWVETHWSSLDSNELHFHCFENKHRCVKIIKTVSPHCRGPLGCTILYFLSFKAFLLWGAGSLKKKNTKIKAFSIAFVGSHLLGFGAEEHHVSSRGSSYLARAL